MLRGWLSGPMLSVVDGLVVTW